MMTRIQDAIEKIRATFAEIERKVSGLPGAWLTWRPSPGVWSILDNLCHIEEYLPYWTSQILAVIYHPDHEWGRTHADSDRLAAVVNTYSRNSASVLSSIHGRIDSISDQLMSLDDKALDTTAPSRNPRWGTKPASFILEHLLVGHLLGHCSQIQRNIDQLKQLGHVREEK
jgi:hypothetical protein